MAHTDELGFRVRAIDPNGTLQLDNKGGGTTSFFWGHPALVHTANGMRGGVVGLPPKFRYGTVSLSDRLPLSGVDDGGCVVSG